MEEVSFRYRGRKRSLSAKKVGFFGRAIGLMFSSREKANILLFEFKESTKTPIHSLFVFFPFVAVWLDKKNRVIDVKRVKPFSLSVSPKGYFFKLIEIPINKRYHSITKIVSRR